MSSTADRTVPVPKAAPGTDPATPPGEEPVTVRELRAILDRGGEFAALDALGLTLTWATDVLRHDTATPAAAFRAVALADRALATAPTFFARLSSLMERGEPAAEVAADLARYAAHLAELDRLAAPRRGRLRELLEGEARLRAETASLNEVNTQIEELERLQRLAAYAAELRSQRDKLEERVGAAASAAAGVEAAISAATGPLLVATRDAIDALKEQTRERLHEAAEQDKLMQARIAECREKAEQAAARTADRQAELAAAQQAAAEELAKYEVARADAVGQATALRRYQAANRAVSEALAARRPAVGDSDSRLSASSGADPVAESLHALSEVQEQLTAIDALLATALAADEGERRVVTPGPARADRSAARHPSLPEEEGARS